MLKGGYDNGHRTRLFGTLIGVALFIAACFVGAAQAQPAADPPQGPVTGFYTGATNDVAAFRGVFYAADTSGNNRFRPPQPRAPWTTPLLANVNNISCASVEDCLILNIFTSANFSGQARPVMMWLHGGGNTSGSSNTFDGTQMVEKGRVVVVTVNYRLGPLGFMALPGLDAESPHGVSGNYGLLDQQFALQWIHNNIAAFGGDPNNVTVFGESAGAVDDVHLLVSPLAAGLFQKMIIESLPYTGTPTHSLADLESFAETSVATKCPQPDPTDVITCLRGLSRAMISALPAINGIGPNLDGYVLPMVAPVAFQTGQFNRVPTIIGTNQTEGAFFISGPIATQAQFVNMISTTASSISSFNTDLTAIKALYTHYGNPGNNIGAANLQGLQNLYPVTQYPTPSFPTGSYAETLMIAYTDAAFHCTTEANRLAMSQWTPVWGYEFNQPLPQGITQANPSTGIITNDEHTSEINYVYGNINGNWQSTLTNTSTANHLTLSNTMVSYWTTFAAAGQPNNPIGLGVRQPTWPAYTTKNRVIQNMINTTTLGDTVGPETNFTDRHKCAFWNNPDPVGTDLASPTNILYAPSGPTP